MAELQLEIEASKCKPCSGTSLLSVVYMLMIIFYVFIYISSLLFPNNII
jgi:hypothetical protein